MTFSWAVRRGAEPRAEPGEEKGVCVCLTDLGGLGGRLSLSGRRGQGIEAVPSECPRPLRFPSVLHHGLERSWDGPLQPPAAGCRAPGLGRCARADGEVGWPRSAIPAVPTQRSPGGAADSRSAQGCGRRPLSRVRAFASRFAFSTHSHLPPRGYHVEGGWRRGAGGGKLSLGSSRCVASPGRGGSVQSDR